jgi:hypothetical protein
MRWTMQMRRKKRRKIEAATKKGAAQLEIIMGYLIKIRPRRTRFFSTVVKWNR